MVFDWDTSKLYYKKYLKNFSDFKKKLSPLEIDQLVHQRIGTSIIDTDQVKTF